MVYTVKKLSELSGVTVRTLHFYEEIGLLKPAYYGSNGYRYYEESQLLQLQQILFFKELGLTLKQIQKILGRSDFDQLAALHAHRKSLSKEWEKIGVLLKTIDKTIKHLKGKKKMKDQEMFDGFKVTLVTLTDGQPYSSAEKIVVQSVKNPTKNAEDVAKRGIAYYDDINKTAHALFKELVHCIEKGLNPAADEVQKIIKKHHAFIQRHHAATKEVYKAMAQLYAEHPDFRKELDLVNPNLANFMAKAMDLFSERKLT
jgi:DNA-binding transcriptional MerR regulator